MNTVIIRTVKGDVLLTINNTTIIPNIDEEVEIIGTKWIVTNKRICYDNNIVVSITVKTWY